MTLKPSDTLKEALNSLDMDLKLRDCERMGAIADRVQSQYVKGRPSIVMAAVFYLRATQDLKAYPLQREVCLAFGCSPPSLRTMVRRIQKYVEAKK